MKKVFLRLRVVALAVPLSYVINAVAFTPTSANAKDYCMYCVPGLNRCDTIQPLGFDSCIDDGAGVGCWEEGFCLAIAQ
jgi:hypothetical protein